MDRLKAAWRNVVYFTRFTLTMSKIGYGARRLTWGSSPLDLSGRSVLITGATAGIGRAATLQALRMGAQVTAIARSAEKLAALKDDAGPMADRLATDVCDLSLLSQTDELCDRLREAGASFDAVINNVGGLFNDYSVTTEGHETSYALNILNHRLLMENLIARGQLNDDACVVNMASAGLYNVPRNIKRLDQEASRYNGVMAYASHKRAQLAMSDHYQKRFADKSWRFYTVHPGWADTPGLQNSMAAFRSSLQMVLRSAEQGADTALWLVATRPEPVEDRLWFDRKARTAHGYAHTRNPPVSVDDVMNYLDGDIASFRDKSGAGHCSPLPSHGGA